jgi:16S rRNA (adenine1518-N6/adenine1519-N6)-dimethyltransferase
MSPVLLGPVEIRALAADLDLRPTKSLGQNFLHDANTIRRIVRTAALAPSETVLEIGPGLGSLTLGLLEAGHPVTAVEIDAVLAAALPATVTARLPRASLTVLTADALRLPELPATQPTALVANLPYNIAVPVVLQLLETVPSLERGLVLVQAEVAERLAAAPGSRIYGVPSVKVAWYASATRAGAVSRTVFWPAPNVDSGLVRLVRRPPPGTSAPRAQVFAVIDAAFAQRRKMLRSALSGWAGSPAAAEAALRAAGIDPTARGETIDVAGFARLAEHRPS